MIQAETTISEKPDTCTGEDAVDVLLTIARFNTAIDALINARGDYYDALADLLAARPRSRNGQAILKDYINNHMGGPTTR